jgi:hypothetical protein
MTQKVADYSWARPGPTTLKNLGFVGIMRYLSYEPGKNLSAGERDSFHNAGLGIGLVWESTANRPIYGASAGAADGAVANQQANALGLPLDRPIYFAMDTDYRRADFPVIAAYFRAAKERIGGRPIGAYIGADFIDWAKPAGVIDYGWIAGAFSWSHEFWKGGGTLPYTPHANLIQLPQLILNGTVDENHTLKDDYGQWPFSGSSAWTPTGKTPEQIEEEELMAAKDEIIAAINNAVNTLGGWENDTRKAVVDGVDSDLAPKVTAAGWSSRPYPFKFADAPDVWFFVPFTDKNGKLGLGRYHIASQAHLSVLTRTLLNPNIQTITDPAEVQAIKDNNPVIN